MKKASRFVNPHVEELRRTLWDLLRWWTGAYKDPLPPPVPASFVYPVPSAVFDPKAPSVNWINHSTFLIQIAGVNFLTDPIWSSRCFRFIGPKRRHMPPVSLDKLPPIHYVLISHDHYDHLDLSTVRALKKLYPEICWLVPLGVKKWFAKEGITNVKELSWWEEVMLGDFTFTAVPAQHFSGRRGSDLNQTLWAGWVVENKREKKRFYFVGDTGYNPVDFKRIGEKWKYMDLSLIPIGSYSPRKFMSPVHIEPRDAVRIHQEVGSLLSIAMHWKTFRLSDEPMNQPPYDLFLSLQSQGVEPTEFLALEPGHALNW